MVKYLHGMKNQKSDGTDTLFVNFRDLVKYQSDENFQNIFIQKMLMYL